MSERTVIAVGVVQTALGNIHAQVAGLAIHNDDLTVSHDALASRHDKLVERSVGAMAIAEGDEGYEKIRIDCPMLESVSNLRARANALQAAADKVLTAYMPIFRDSRAVDDCLVGLAAAVGRVIVIPDPPAGLASTLPAMHETNYFRHFLLAKLSKCAFCGSSELAIQQVATEERGDGFVVDCIKCGASGPHTRGMVSACAAWNERAQ